MANTWLRLRYGMLNDPKWQTIVRVPGQLVAAIIAVCIHLLANASQNVTTYHGASLCGHTGVTTEGLVSAFDMAGEVTDLVLQAVQGRILDEDLIAGWKKHQVLKEGSDNVSRTAKPPAERKEA